MPARSIRVLVVEDYEPFQRLVASILQKQPELQIICRVSDGREAVQKAEELQPDLIVLDIGLPSLMESMSLDKSASSLLNPRYFL